MEKRLNGKASQWKSVSMEKRRISVVWSHLGRDQKGLRVGEAFRSKDKQEAHRPMPSSATLSTDKGNADQRDTQRRVPACDPGTACFSGAPNETAELRTHPTFRRPAAGIFVS